MRRTQLLKMRTLTYTPAAVQNNNEPCNATKQTSRWNTSCRDRHRLVASGSERPVRQGVRALKDRNFFLQYDARPLAHADTPARRSKRAAN